MLHIMHDIETLDTKTSAVVLSIGAVKFDKNGIYDHINLRLNLSDQSDRSISASTVQWWLQQSEAARAAVSTPSHTPLAFTLNTLAGWYGRDPIAGVWGNGAMFDNAIILDLYEKAGLPRPWSYKVDRCYRTLRAVAEMHPLVDIDYVRPTTAHDALADAVAQAENAIKMLGILNAWEY